MNDTGPGSIMVTPEDREISDKAEAIRNALSSRILLWSKHISIDLGEGEFLGLTLSRMRKKKGWKIALDSDRTDCPECRGQAAEIYDHGSELPHIPRIQSWLRKIVHTHTSSHSCGGNSAVTENVGSNVIRVQRTDDTSSTRIKVLTPGVADNSGVATESASRSRIKISEPSPNVGVSTALKVQTRPSGRQIQPESESIRSAPCISYRLARGDAIEVTFPVGICNSLIEHCRTSLQHGREVGGVLIGVVTERPNAPCSDFSLTITDLIPFRPADSSGDRLHLTSDSWAHVGQVESACGYESEHKVRLGWYHTHPTQGIFFSRYDKDFHTVFSKPLQFAIVVDPRRMEAGIFYWDDPEDDPGQRSLVGPSNFSLRRDREAEPELVRAVAVQPPEPVRRKIAWQRVLILAILLMIVFVTALLDNTLTWGPDQVTFGAAVILLVLALWNAHWFQPEDALERRALTQLEQLIDRLRPSPHQPAQRAKRALRLPWRILAATFISLVFMAAVFGLAGHRIRKWMTSLSSKPEVSIVPRQSPKPESTAEQNQITILIDTPDGHVTLAYPKNQRVMVSYERTSDKWSCDENAEKDFFQTVFDWDIQKPQEYIKPLQVSLGLTKTPDGRWGPNTRTAFVDAALNHNRDPKGLAMTLGDKSQAQVLFKPSAQ